MRLPFSNLVDAIRYYQAEGHVAIDGQPVDPLFWGVWFRDHPGAVEVTEAMRDALAEWRSTCS